MSVCIPVIRVCGAIGSRWIFWKRRIFLIKCARSQLLCGAASALNAEYIPFLDSRSVVITRMAGRTPVPEKNPLKVSAAHRQRELIFLSTGMLEELSKRLIGYQPELHVCDCLQGNLGG